MKNLISLLIITLSLLILSKEESDAQCTCPPANQKTFNMTIPGTSCQVTVVYCLDCQPTGHASMELCHVIIPNSYHCYGIPIDAAFWASIKQSMVFDAAAYCGNIGPCPQKVVYEVYDAACKRLVFVNPTDGGAPYIKLEPCPADPGICKQEFELCWDGFNFNVNVSAPVLIETGECNYQPIFIPENPTSLYPDCFNSCYNL